MSTTIPSPARAATAVKKPSIRPEQLWLPVAVVLAAVIAGIGWMMLISPARQEATSVTAQAQSVADQNTALQHQIATLKSEQADLGTYRSELAAAQAALPVDSGMPSVLRSLQDIGNATGVTVSAVTASAPTVFGGTGATSNGSVAAPVAGTVYQLPVTITAKGPGTALVTFLAKLQSDAPRALLISDVHFSEQLDITATAFLQPTAAATGGK